MKEPVIKLKDLIDVISNLNLEISKQVEIQLTPEEQKKLALKALSLKNEKGLMAFKSLMDNIKNQSFVEGELAIISALLKSFNEKLEKYNKDMEDKNGSI